MNGTVKALACLVFLISSSMVFAIGADEMASLKNRFDEEKGIDYGTIDQATDIRSITAEWNKNPARATIKFNKPTAYRGKLKRIAVRNESDGDLVFDGGNGQEITAVLYPYQLGGWARNSSTGKWRPSGGVTTMEFAAEYDPGQDFILSCKHAQPGYLIDCLATPTEVVESL